jgi:PAS domain S-box-containing protein
VPTFPDEAAAKAATFFGTFRSVGIAVALTEMPSQCFVAVNHAFEELYGFSESEVRGKTSRALGIQRDAEQQASTVRTFLKGWWKTRAPRIVYDKEERPLEIFVEIIAVRLDGARYALTFIDAVAAVAEQHDRLSREITDEQHRLAQELHDGLGQTLAGVALLAEAILNSVAQGKAIAQADAQRMADAARGAVSECSRISHGLAPLKRPEELLEALRTLCEGIPDPRIVFTAITRSENRVPLFAANSLLRIAQQAVLNSLKHSAARRIRVALSILPSAVHLHIEDDGVGFGGKPAAYSAMGLRSMAQRAAMFGGTLDIEDDNGVTRICCRCPQPRRPRTVTASS